MKLIFDDYVFDIANEQLIVGEKTIDLKAINGSTNEYVPIKKEEQIDVDLGDFVTKYNELVNNFQQYVENATLMIESSQQVNMNNFFVTDGSNNQASSNSGTAAKNETTITKHVSLRGAISYPSYIDVTYIVSDVADKYEGVYLLVTGVIDGEMASEKILLDKYATTYRIYGLEPKNEYSISLGYYENAINFDGEKYLADNIEDVINVRTPSSNMSLEIEKISKGFVYFNFKMSNSYALESGRISLFTDERYQSSIQIDPTAARSKNGFSSKIQLVEGTIVELRLEQAIFNQKEVQLNVKKKFVY
jgi:hypothetical protein